MKQFENCLLACDVDDTLMYNGVIPQRNLEQIKRFMEAGGHFSIATGRTVSAVSGILEQLGEISPSVFANGCMVYDFGKKEILWQTIIEKDEHRIARRMVKSGLRMGVEVHCQNHIYIVLEHAEARDHEAYEGYTGETVSIEDIEECDWNKVLYLFADEPEREKGKQIIADLRADSAFSDTSAVIQNRRRYFYEQFPHGVSKATGVAVLAEILRIKPGGLFAMGDYYNDMRMMGKADISAAPAGAPEDIRHVADFVGGSCKDGAVADFIEYLFHTRKD